MSFVNFYNKKKKKLTDTISGLGAVAREYKQNVNKNIDIARDTYNPKNLYKSAGKIMNNPTEISRGLEQFNYLKPTKKVRARDFAREVPGAIAETAKSMFTGTYNVASKAPKIFGEGLAYATSKNVRDQYKKGNTDILPTVSNTSPKQIVADTGRAMLEVSTAGRIPKALNWMNNASKIKRTAAGAGLGYGFDVLGKIGDENKVDLKPGIGTALGGVFGYAAPPLARGIQKESKNVVKDISNFKNPYSKRIVTKSDYRPDGGAMVHGRPQLMPVPGTERTVIETIKKPFKPQSMLGKVLTAKPGLTVQDVNNNKTKVISSEVLKFNKRMAEKGNRAKALVAKQLQNQRLGKNKAEKGFVSPQALKPPQRVIPEARQGKLPDIEEYVNKKTGEIKSIKTSAEDVPFRGDEFSKPRAGEILEKNINKRPQVKSTKTITDIFENYIAPEINKKPLPAIEKFVDGKTSGDLLKKTPQGRNPRLENGEPTIMNQHKWLRAIGAVRSKKDLEKIGFKKGQEIIDKWRMKVQPDYPRKKAEMNKFKDFISDFQSSEEKGITRGLEYLKKYVGIPANKAEQIIYYLDKPGQVPKDIAPLVDDLRKQFNDFHTEAKMAGLDVGYWQNYIMHIWSESPQTVAKKIREGIRRGILTEDDLAPISNTTTSFFRPSNARMLKTYEAGAKIGLHKKYNHPAQIIAHYAKELEKSKAIMRNIQQLKKEGLVVEGIQPGMTALNVPGAEGLAAESSLAKKINNAFSTHEYTGVGKVLEYASNTSRWLKETLMSGGLPTTTVNSYGISMTLKEIGTLSPTRAKNAIASFIIANNPRASRRFFIENKGQIDKIRRNDMRLSTMIDNGGFIEEGGIKGILKDFFGDSSGKGFFGGIAAHWQKTINEPTFGRYLPMNQIKFFNSVESRLLKKGYSPARAEKIAAKELREGMGQGSAALEAGKSKEWKDWRETLFFAPTHRMNMLRVFANAGKALVRNPFKPGNQSAAQFLAGGVAVYMMYDWINYKNTGHHMWDNPEGKKFEAYIKGDNEELYSVPYMPSVATMPRLGVKVGEKLVKGDMGEALGSAWQGTGSILSKPIADVVMNQDYFGRPIANEKDDPSKQYGEKGKYLVKQYTGHPWMKAGFDIAEGKPTKQVLAQALEAPIRFNTEDKLATSQYWNKFKNEVEPKYLKFKDLVKTDTAKANEYYLENKEAIDEYPRLRNMSEMYSNLKEKDLKDEFGTIVKNEGFGLKNPDKPWMASLLGDEAQANTTRNDIQSTDGMSEDVKNIFNEFELNEKKKELVNSGKKFMLWNGKALILNDSGNVSVKSEDEYQSLVNGAQLTNLKRNDNIEKWFEVAEKQIKYFENQLNDPEIDELSKIKVQDDIDRLVDDYQKFGEYGGFTKPKAGKKLEEKYRYSLIDPEFMRIQSLIAGINLKPTTARRARSLMFSRLPKVRRRKRK